MATNKITGLEATQCEATVCASTGAKVQRAERDAKLQRDILETIAIVRKANADILRAMHYRRATAEWISSITAGV